MKTMRIIRAIFSSAVLIGVGTPAVASASVFCRSFWPKSVTQCQSDNESATGSGANVVVGANNRQITVNWLAGTVKAQAAALNSAGSAIAGCIVEDNTVNTGSPQTVNCFTANAPSFVFVTAD